jgi:hypothetical protein
MYFAEAIQFHLTTYQASGTLGTKVVEALLSSGFDVTAITRNESTATFPEKVTVKKVDITSVDSVKDAIAGQHAVVSTAATAAAGNQKVIIDAVIAAKVPRFIPSEFGIPSREYRDTKIGGLLAPKIRNTDYLIELAKQHEWFSWTGVSNGLFLDWVGFRGSYSKKTSLTTGLEHSKRQKLCRPQEPQGHDR